ncbi:hypothetical protein B0H14DRAFT_1621916 [Mycena olivaceomarginata]|nr:hypothetical protein B0H14DRAFT_1621916 [Mycena olivaceomarginata]
MPTSKFTYPRNGDILATNAPMTVGLAITNFASGNFANVQTNYLAAPQQLDSNGRNPRPRNDHHRGGCCGPANRSGSTCQSIIATTNGNPALLPTLQHGAVDDAIYFVVVDGGPLPTNQTALPNSVPSTSKTSSASGTAKTNIPSQSSASIASVGKTHVGAAVGGALAGIAILVLGLVGIWFFIRRRRRNAQASQLAGYPAVLNSEDFRRAITHAVHQRNCRNPTHEPGTAAAQFVCAEDGEGGVDSERSEVFHSLCCAIVSHCRRMTIIYTLFRSSWSSSTVHVIVQLQTRITHYPQLPDPRYLNKTRRPSTVGNPVSVILISPQDKMRLSSNNQPQSNRDSDNCRIDTELSIGR